VNSASVDEAIVSARARFLIGSHPLGCALRSY
jgi:hypothetical protein